MLGFGKNKKADVLSHWYAWIPNFSASTQEFYAAIEKELQLKEVPGLEISRVEFSEGGLLSAKREYLRMTRERLVFDICAAPFGTSYFYSMRFAELPSAIKPLQILLFFLLLFFVFFIFVKMFGVVFGTLLLLAAVIFGIWFLRNAISMGLKDLDATLLKTPILGPVYEAFFRKETYYREDTRLMYLEVVNAIVRQRVEEVTTSKGIKLLQIKQHSSLLDALYQPAVLSPTQPLESVAWGASTNH